MGLLCPDHSYIAQVLTSTAAAITRNELLPPFFQQTSDNDMKRLSLSSLHPSPSSGRTQLTTRSFVAPVASPACMRPYTDKQLSALHVMQRARAATRKFVVVVPLEGLACRLRVVVNAMCLVRVLCCTAATSTSPSTSTSPLPLPACV